MASVLYIPSQYCFDLRFRALLGTEIPNKEFEYYRSIEKLSVRLSMPESVNVAVLFALSRTEIMEILSISDLLADVKKVIVLADNDKDTIIKAHTLRPRYIAWLDCDFSNIVTVLKRMIDLYDVSPRAV